MPLPAAINPRDHTAVFVVAALFTTAVVVYLVNASVKVVKQVKRRRARRRKSAK